MTLHNQTLLKGALALNLALSTASGLIAIFASERVSAVTGLGPSWLILGIGIGLLFFAAGIAWTLVRFRLGQALLISVLDLFWVVGTVPLTMVPGLLTSDGAALIVGLAAIVGALGLIQLLAIRAILSEGAEQGRYRHCIRVSSEVAPHTLWSVIRDLGAMSRYSAGLSTSELVGGTEPGPGTARVCTDHKGQSWTEDVERLDDDQRLVLLRFRSEAEDFPFPLAELSGGWWVQPNPTGGSLVDIWWDVRPKQMRLGWLVVALMTVALDRDVPTIVAAMESDARGESVPTAMRRPSLAYC